MAEQADDGDVERAISLFISQEDIGHTVEESGSLLSPWGGPEYVEDRARGPSPPAPGTARRVDVQFGGPEFAGSGGSRSASGWRGVRRTAAHDSHSSAKLRPEAVRECGKASRQSPSSTRRTSAVHAVPPFSSQG